MMTEAQGNTIIRLLQDIKLLLTPKAKARRAPSPKVKAPTCAEDIQDEVNYKRLYAKYSHVSRSIVNQKVEDAKQWMLDKWLAGDWAKGTKPTKILTTMRVYNFLKDYERKTKEPTRTEI